MSLIKDLNNNPLTEIYLMSLLRLSHQFIRQTIYALLMFQKTNIMSFLQFLYKISVHLFPVPKKFIIFSNITCHII